LTRELKVDIYIVHNSTLDQIEKLVYEESGRVKNQKVVPWSSAVPGSSEGAHGGTFVLQKSQMEEPGPQEKISPWGSDSRFWG
jgi:hypothetical protein